MAKANKRNQNKSLVNGTGKKCTSQGVGGRGRRVKVGMSTMNKSKKRSAKSIYKLIDDLEKKYIY